MKAGNAGNMSPHTRRNFEINAIHMLSRASCHDLQNKLRKKKICKKYVNSFYTFWLKKNCNFFFNSGKNIYKYCTSLLDWNVPKILK